MAVEAINFQLLLSTAEITAAQAIETGRPQSGDAPTQLAHTEQNSRHALPAPGATLREAQAQLGNSKMSTTLEIYTIAITQAQRKAVENLSHLATNGHELGKTREKLPMLTEWIQ